MKTETDKKAVVSDGRAPRSLRSVVVRDLIDVTWRMTLPTVAGLFAGMALDGVLSTSPIGFLVGATVGFAVGVYLALRLLKAASEGKL